MNYYYLAASLPLTRFGEPPPMAMEAFLDACQGHLTARDQSALRALLNPEATPSDHPFVQQWRTFDTTLRNALVRQRATRLKKDPHTFLREDDGPDARIERGLKEALGRHNPIEREQAMDRLRWQGIDDLAGLNPFASEGILAYALKLRLAHRWAALDATAGADRVEALLERTPAEEEKAA